MWNSMKQASTHGLKICQNVISRSRTSDYRFGMTVRPLFAKSLRPYSLAHRRVASSSLAQYNLLKGTRGEGNQSEKD